MRCYIDASVYMDPLPQGSYVLIGWFVNRFFCPQEKTPFLCKFLQVHKFNLVVCGKLCSFHELHGQSHLSGHLAQFCSCFCSFGVQDGTMENKGNFVIIFLFSPLFVSSEQAYQKPKILWSFFFTFILGQQVIFNRSWRFANMLLAVVYYWPILLLVVVLLCARHNNMEQRKV